MEEPKVLVDFFKKYLKQGAHSEEELRKFAADRGYEYSMIDDALKQAKQELAKPPVPRAQQPKPVQKEIAEKIPAKPKEAAAAKPIAKAKVSPAELWEKFPAFLRKNRIYVGLSIVVLIILIAIFLFSTAVKVKDCKDDMDCFMAEAQECNEAVLTRDTEGNTVHYTSTEDCTLIIKMEYVNDQEPPEIIALLEGREMECQYEKGSLNPIWVDHFMNSFEYCEGSLKDAIQQLMTESIRLEAEEELQAETDELVEEYWESHWTT